MPSGYYIRTPTDVWPEERVALLRKLWAEGVSYAKMAKELNTTRNSVSGKLHRLGLKLKPAVKRERELVGSKRGGRTRAKEMWAGHVKGAAPKKPKPKPIKRSPTRKVGVLFPDDPASRAAFALLARAEAAESRCNAWRRSR